MKRQEDRQGACTIVIEAGAEWPAFGHEPAGTDIHAVIPQQPDETPAELALRAADRVASLGRGGASVQSVVIAVGAVHDDEVFAARCSVARALIAELGAGGEAELTFSAPALLTDGARHELLALAGTLASQAYGSAFSVNVRFSAAPVQRRDGAGAGRAPEILPDVA